MNNKILIGLFAAIMLVVLCQGLHLIDNIKQIADQNKLDINKELVQFEIFLYYVGVLTTVITAPLLLKSKSSMEKKKLTKKIQEIKKRGDLEKYTI